MEFDTFKYIYSNNKLKIILLIASILLLPVILYFILSQGQNLSTILAGILSGTYMLYLIVSIYDMLGMPDENDDVSTWLDKQGIQNDIDNIISGYDISFPAENSLIPRWKTDPDPSEILDSDSEIMVLKSTANEEWNLGAAAIQYSRNCVIPESRPFVRDDIEMGIETFVAQDILEKEGKEDAVGYLHQHLSHEYKKMGDNEYEHIRAAILATSNVRKWGFFGPVLLNEYNEKTKHGPPNDLIKNESAEFLYTLEDIAIRDEPGELSNPGHYFDIKIGIVGGYMPADDYTKRAKEAIADHQISYSIAEGEKIDLAEKMAPELSKENMGEAIEKSESERFHLDDDIEYDEIFTIRLQKEYKYR